MKFADDIVFIGRSAEGQVMLEKLQEEAVKIGFKINNYKKKVPRINANQVDVILFNSYRSGERINISRKNNNSSAKR